MRTILAEAPTCPRAGGSVGWQSSLLAARMADHKRSICSIRTGSAVQLHHTGFTMAKRTPKQPIDPDRLFSAFHKRGYFNQLPTSTVASIQAKMRQCAAEKTDPRLGILIVEGVRGPAEEQAFNRGGERAQAWLTALAAGLELEPQIALDRWSDETVAFLIDGRRYGVGEGFPRQVSGIVGKSSNQQLVDALAATEGVFNHWASARAKYIGCAAVAAAGTFGFALDPVGDGDLCLLNSLPDDLALEERWQSLLDWQFIFQQD